MQPSQARGTSHRRQSQWRFSCFYGTTLAELWGLCWSVEAAQLYSRVGPGP